LVVLDVSRPRVRLSPRGIRRSWGDPKRKADRRNRLELAPPTSTSARGPGQKDFELDFPHCFLTHFGSKERPSFTKAAESGLNISHRAVSAAGSKLLGKWKESAFELFAGPFGAHRIPRTAGRTFSCTNPNGVNGRLLVSRNTAPEDAAARLPNTS